MGAVDVAASYVFGLPYIEMARTRAAFHAAGAPTGRFVHTRKLTSAADRWITTPNNDTPYSNAWLDLSHGPVELVTPEFGDRYWSVALMAMTTDNFAIIGTRTYGNRPGRFLIVGPDWQGDGGDWTVLRSPTNWVWALARVLVDGPDDLAAVHALQDLLILTPRQAQPPARLPAPLIEGDAADYFRLLRELLAENPPGAADRDAVANLATVAGDSMVEGYALGVAHVRGGGSMGKRNAVNGWNVPPAVIGVYGSEYGIRAGVALGGLGALPPEEAMYLSAGGAHLVGNTAFRLIFAADAPVPVQAFWSLTLYERTPEGRLFFFDNPLDRYAIGDRSPGLRHSEDGSLEILIQAARPHGHEGNWLPAPAGRYSLNLRCYLPKPALLDGTWQPPRLLPVAM